MSSDTVRPTQIRWGVSLKYCHWSIPTIFFTPSINKQRVLVHKKLYFSLSQF